MLQVLLWQVEKQLRIREVGIKLRDLTDDLRVTVVEGGLTLSIFIIDHNLLAIREEESGTLEEGQSTKEERQIIDCHLLRDAFTDIRGSDDILLTDIVSTNLPGSIRIDLLIALKLRSTSMVCLLSLTVCLASCCIITGGNFRFVWTGR